MDKKKIRKEIRQWLNELYFDKNTLEILELSEIIEKENARALKAFASGEELSGIW